MLDTGCEWHQWSSVVLKNGVTVKDTTESTFLFRNEGGGGVTGKKKNRGQNARLVSAEKVFLPRLSAAISRRRLISAPFAVLSVRV